MADGRTVAVMNAANAGARMPRTTTATERRCGRSSSADQEPGCTARGIRPHAAGCQRQLVEQAPDPAAEIPGERNLDEPLAFRRLAAGPERLADAWVALAHAAAGIPVDRRHDDARRRDERGRGRAPEGSLHHVGPDGQRDVGAGETDRTRVVRPDPDTDDQVWRVTDEPRVPKSVRR